MSKFDVVQHWKNVFATDKTSVACEFDVPPTRGNLVLVGGEITRPVTFKGITDDFGDGVPWTLHPNSFIAGTAFAYLYLAYKTAGAPVGGGKTITVATSELSSRIVGHIAEYPPGVLDGGLYPCPSGQGYTSESGPVTVVSPGSLVLILSSPGISGPIPIPANPAIIRSKSPTWSSTQMDVAVCDPGTHQFDSLGMRPDVWSMMTAGFAPSLSPGVPKMSTVIVALTSKDVTVPATITPAGWVARLVSTTGAPARVQALATLPANNQITFTDVPPDTYIPSADRLDSAGQVIGSATGSQFTVPVPPPETIHVSVPDVVSAAIA